MYPMYLKTEQKAVTNKLNGYISSKFTMTNDIQQGAILRPLLFVVLFWVGI